MKEESKTVREWLMMLKEPYRSKAIRNGREHGNLELDTNSLGKALLYAFNWQDSRESCRYWESIYRSIGIGETEYLAEGWMPIEVPLADKFKEAGRKRAGAKPIPREVEVTLHGFWQKTELIADLSEFNVERPYVVRHITRTNETMMYSNIKEIKKEPESFGDYLNTYISYFGCSYDTEEFLNRAYADYQEYLTQFDS